MMRIATKVAHKSPFFRHRLGAVVVKGGRVLSTGYNEIRFTKELRNSTLHAEEAAILSLLKKNKLHELNNSEIYVSRITPGGRTGLSKPCARCMELIRSVGIASISYTTDENSTETIKL
jgi:deoxycytidylate deaminase